MVVNSLRGLGAKPGTGDMNKIWLVSAALVAALASGSAFAADLPAAPQVYAPRPALVPPIYSWTGCYLGIEGGGTWGRSQQIAGTSPVPANVGLPITDPFNVNGALFGGTVGCNYQFGSVVFGVENDFSWTNKSGSSPDIPPFAAGAVKLHERGLARHSARPRGLRVGSLHGLRDRWRRLCRCRGERVLGGRDLRVATRRCEPDGLPALVANGRPGPVPAEA